MPGSPWTTHDISVLAIEYFRVLDTELAGGSVNKAAALRAAGLALQGSRTEHTLKDRCYRISEELAKRNLPWVNGWKPPALVGQAGNTPAVSKTIWDAIQPFALRYEATTAPADLVTTPAAGSQTYATDSAHRKAVEDVAQNRLVRHFEGLGWDVDDTHLTSPFDARATLGSCVLYLEAKGTGSQGETVFVTNGEVEWARTHPGECIMGIVSGIRTLPDGTVDADSGELRLLNWNPDSGWLRPIQFQWRPDG